MPPRHRLTTNAGETDLASLLSGDTVFSIPYFQRPYRWGLDKLKQLDMDLLRLVDESADFHFMGAIIIHGRRSNPSEPNIYEVIDGQQRITTVFIYLCAIVRTLCEQGRYSEAAGLFLKYLVIGRETALSSNAKMHPCKDDRAQMNFLIGHLLTDEAFQSKIQPFQYKPLPTTGSDKGRLRNNYKGALRFFGTQVEKEGIARLESLYKVLLDQISIVQIDVWDPTNGPKIFDSLNSRQEPMTTGDLVRNEIFSRIADHPPEQIEAIDVRSWQPFYNKFKQGDKILFDDYFFPYGLIQDPNLQKSEVYSKLRESWREISDPEVIVTRLEEYQNSFLDVLCGTNTQGLSPSLHEGFARLHACKAPSSTHPFTMRLSNALRDGAVTEADGLAILKLIESFLVRRAICGHEPTGLHAVFKRLWGDCGGAPNTTNVEEQIRRHRTVVWPSGDDVKVAVCTRPLDEVGITPYVLTESNRSLRGDQPHITPWIEHVLPENPDHEWFDFFTPDQHKTMKGLLANLIPLSQEMNQVLGNKPYRVKREVYLEDSGFKVARTFAKAHEVWNPEELSKRSDLLAEWVVGRWPH